MHELSIANSLVEVATESAAQAGASRVTEVRLRLGVLSGVVRGALEFCFEAAVAGTPLEGATLVIEELPVRIFCHACQKESELASIQRFRCPLCQGPADDIRQGRELELAAIEIDLPDAVVAASAHSSAA